MLLFTFSRDKGFLSAGHSVGEGRLNKENVHNIVEVCEEMLLRHEYRSLMYWMCY